MSFRRRADEASELAHHFEDHDAPHAAALCRGEARSLRNLLSLGYDEHDPSPSWQPGELLNPPHPPRVVIRSPIDRTAVPWSPQAPAAERPLRRALYRLRNRLRPLQRFRIAMCGFGVVSERVSVVVDGEGRGRLCGLATCGSVHECPGCRGAICTKRAAEVRRVVESHGAARCVMVTLTLRHGAGDDLRKLRTDLSRAHAALCRGEPWKRFQARMGIVGSIRALEVTHGENGWHPHLHILWLLDDRPQASDVYDIGDPAKPRREWLFSDRGWFIDRWCTMVERHVGEKSSPDPTVGVSVSPVTASYDPETGEATGAFDYIAKLGLELSDPGTKSGKHGRTPLQIGADYAAEKAKPEGERSRRKIGRDAWLWRSYCEAMMGARQLTWSRGLKDAHGIVDRSDAELAEDEQEVCDDRIVATIPAETWKLIRILPWAQAWLLEELEAGGVRRFERALAVCDEQAREKSSGRRPRRGGTDEAPVLDLRRMRREAHRS